MSEGVKALWGYEREEFLADSKFWADRLHPDDVTRVFAGLEHLTHVDEYCHEYRFRHKIGEYRWVRDELRMLRDPTGSMQLAGEVMQRAQERLIRSLKGLGW